MKKQLISTIFVFLLLISSVFADVSIEYSNVKITETVDGRIVTNFDLKNSGTETAPDFLVEAQTIDPSESLFSFFAFLTDQKVCEANSADNVYRIVQGLLPQSTINVNLITPPLPPNTYQIKGVSVNQCCNLGSCVETQPFKFGKLLGTITTTKGKVNITCGDKQCSASENVKVCPADCGPSFGDGVCSPGESLPNEAACVAPVPPPATKDDSDGDGIINSEDKCREIQPIDYKGNKITNPNRLPKTINGKDNPLYGCPIIQIQQEKPEVLGDIKNDLGVPIYQSTQYVPVKFTIFKDQNFDLGDLKIEAGVYDINEPTLGGTFSIVPVASVIGQNDLFPVEGCVKGEENVQAVKINTPNTKKFSEISPYDAKFILVPSWNKPTHLTKEYAIAIRAYTKCGEPITANTLARVILQPQEQSFHNIIDGNKCVTISGGGEDRCANPQKNSGTGTDDGNQGTPVVQSTCKSDSSCPVTEYCGETILEKNINKVGGGVVRLAADGVGCWGGILAATKIGALVGGATGTAVVPVAGTTAGAVLGGGIGFTAGAVGCLLGASVADTITKGLSEGIDIRQNICIEKKKSLTIEEIKESTPKSLIPSLCEEKTQCAKRENDEGIDMSVSCTQVETIEQQESFDTGLTPQFFVDFQKEGLILGTFKQTGELIVGVETPTGICVATPKSENILANIGKFLGFNGKEAEYAGIGVIVGGLALLFFLFGRK